MALFVKLRVVAVSNWGWRLKNSLPEVINWDVDIADGIFVILPGRKCGKGNNEENRQPHSVYCVQNGALVTVALYLRPFELR